MDLTCRSTTDVRIIDAICRGACERVPRTVVLMPTVTHGYSPHHADFPGPISIRWNIFVEHLLDITRSLVGHGFRRFILANGHGSNMPLVNMAARLTIIEHPQTIACDYFYLYTPGGHRGHKERSGKCISRAACPMPVSSRHRLPSHGSSTRTDGEGREGFQHPPSDYFYFDWISGPGSMMEYWSTLSRNGTMGDPTEPPRRRAESPRGSHRRTGSIHRGDAHARDQEARGPSRSPRNLV